MVSKGGAVEAHPIAVLASRAVTLSRLSGPSGEGFMGFVGRWFLLGRLASTFRPLGLTTGPIPRRPLCRPLCRPLVWAPCMGPCVFDIRAVELDGCRRETLCGCWWFRVHRNGALPRAGRTRGRGDGADTQRQRCQAAVAFAERGRTGRMGP